MFSIFPVFIQHVCSHTYGYVHILVCECADVDGHFLLQPLPALFLEVGSLTAPIARQFGSIGCPVNSRDPPVSTSVLGFQVHVAVPGFCVATADQNPSPQTWATSPLLTEPSPQLQFRHLISLLMSLESWG